MPEITIPLKFSQSPQLGRCLDALDVFLKLPDKPVELGGRVLALAQSPGSLITHGGHDDTGVVLGPTPEFAQVAEDIWRHIELAGKTTTDAPGSLCDE